MLAMWVKTLYISRQGLNTVLKWPVFLSPDIQQNLKRETQTEMLEVG